MLRCSQIFSRSLTFLYNCSVFTTFILNFGKFKGALQTSIYSLNVNFPYIPMEQLKVLYPSLSKEDIYSWGGK